MDANQNPFGGILLLLLVALTVWAIIKGKGMKWKLLNLLIIVGSIAFGLGTGFAAGMWSDNMSFGGHLGLALGSLFGVVGAYECVSLNKRRNAIAAAPEPVVPGGSPDE